MKYAEPQKRRRVATAGKRGEGSAMSDEKLVRPVRCQICAQPMYYSSDSRHVQEVRVEVVGKEAQSDFYVHVTCWNERMKPARETEGEP